MTEDLETRLRQTLQAKAAEVHAAPDAWSRYPAGNVTVLRRGPDRRVLVAVPAAIVALAAAVFVGFLVGRPAGRAHEVAAGRSSSVAAAPAPATPGPVAAPLAAPSAGATVNGAADTAAGPAAGPVPAGFEPASVTFVSPLVGWVLGTAPCRTPPCTSVLRTRDGGRTWAGISAPPAGLSNGTTGGVAHLRFADDRNGWAYGGTQSASVLYATHDGGATWHPVPLPVSGQLSALETAAGLVHAVVITNDGTVRIATSPAGSDRWTVATVTIPVGAGPVPHAQLVLQGTTGWVIEVDRTVVGGARLVNGAWAAWSPPCAQVQGPAILAASSPTDLVASCQVGLWSEPSGEHLFVSHDGGATFAEAPGPADPTPGSVAIASPGRAEAVLGAVSAQGVAMLVATFDGGSSWVTVYQGGPGARSVDELGFTTVTEGVAVIGDPGQRSLMVKSANGGRSWTTVTFSS